MVDDEGIASFCEVTRSQGEDYFGETADNLTAVIVDLTDFIASLTQRNLVRAESECDDLCT